MNQPELDLVRGTLNLLILKTLSWGPMHGLAVLRWIENATHDQLQIEEGALYPALHRMESKGWLAAEWGYTDRNRKAKFYRLTPAGRKQLDREIAGCEVFKAAAAFPMLPRRATVAMTLRSRSLWRRSMRASVSTGHTALI